MATTFDALGRALEQNRSASYTEVVYAPSGQKFAFMNSQTLIKYIDPMVAGMAAVHVHGSPQDTGYFQHADWLGSSRWAHDGGGNVIYDRAYAPFGEVYAESGGATNRDFTGQTEDTTPGLYDFLFRQQSQSQGRWLVPDPAGLAAVDLSNPQSWNRYAYVGNNPLGNVDPLGLYMKGPPPIVDPPVDETSFGGFGVGGGGYLNPLRLQLLPLDGPGGPTPSLRDFLKNCEGHAGPGNYGLYTDSRNNCTIGIGHFVAPHPCGAAESLQYPNGMTQTEAEDQLSTDMAATVSAVSDAAPTDLNQGQFDAMVSLAFNMGLSKLETHDDWKSLMSGDYAQVPADILTLGAGGRNMKNRRANEAQMFDSGIYNTNCYVAPGD